MAVLTISKFFWVKNIKPNQVFAFFAAAYIVFASNFPVILPFAYVHDGGLSISQAFSFSEGDWMGAYDNKTLLRGPGFPIFLASWNLLGISVIVGHAIFRTLAVVYLRRQLLCYSNKTWLATIFSIVVLFNPFALPAVVIRDYFYGDLVIFLFASFIAILVKLPRPREIIVPTIVAGVSAGLMALTREENIWLYLFAGVFLVSVIFTSIKQRTLKRLIYPIVAIFLATAMVVSVRFINLGKYESFTVSERDDKTLASVLNNLYSIKFANHIDYVPVPGSTRKFIYAKSNSFSELEAELENPDNPWKQFGCQLYKNTCGDYAGGWFEFAFRDAMQAKGYYSDTKTRAAFLTKLNSELEQICLSENTECSQINLPMTPVLSEAQVSKLPAAVTQGLFYAFGGEQTPIAGLDALSGDPELNARYSDYLQIGSHQDGNYRWTEKVSMKIESALAQLYKSSTPVQIFLLTALTALIFVRRRNIKRKPLFYWLLGLTLFALFTRVSMLALIEISLFPGFQNTYLQPSFFLAALTLYLLLDAVDFKGLIQSARTSPWFQRRKD